MKNGLRVAIDTNIIFMFLYRLDSKAGLIIKAAAEDKIELVSTDSVKEEIKKLVKRELNYTDFEVEEMVENLPITWYNREIYMSFLDKSRIMPHKPDRPLVALALLLNCGILSANYNDFKHVKKSVKVWDVNELLEEIKK